MNINQTMGKPPRTDLIGVGLNHATEGQAPGELLDIAGGLLKSYAEDLERLRLQIQAGNTAELKESRQLVRDLRAATQLVLEERSKVDKLRKNVAGEIGAGALDLDAARDEIGRRLACLRRAGTA